MASQKFIIASNTASQIAGRVVSSGANFLTTLILARSLGVLGYGDFSKITTFVSFFYLITDLGINASYLRLKEEKATITWNHLLSLRLILAFVSIFLCIAVLSFLPQGQEQGYTSMVRFGIILYSLSILFHAGITTTNAVFQQGLAYHRATISLCIGAAVTLLLAYLFVGNSILTATVAIMAGTAATMTASFFLAKPLVESIAPRWSLSITKQLLLDAIPLSLTLVFNLVYFRVDTIILTLTQSTTAIGLYSLAYKFFEFPLVLPLFFMNAMYPILLKKFKESPLAFNNTLFFAGKILLALGIVGSLCCYFLAPFIGTINSSFLDAVPIFQLLSLSLPIFFLSSLTMWAFITLKKNVLLVLIYGSSMVGNLLANIIFVPQYGYWASAWITIIGEAAVLAISLLVLHQLINTSKKA